MDIVLNKEIADVINDFEIESLKLPQAECPVIHQFINNQYIREVHLPKGILAIGHHQNFQHINVFLKGKVLMLQDDMSVKEICAPKIFIGNPGRKIGYILEDVVWQNVYQTSETDIETLETMYLTKSEVFKNHEEKQFLLQHISKQEDRDDFQNTIKTLGYTESEVHEISVQEDDKLYATSLKYSIQDSPIHGKGVFASCNLSSGDVLDIAKIDNKRTLLGRYLNHSKNPNSKIVYDELNDVFVVIITENIIGKCGGTNGAEITVDYKQVLEENLKYRK